MTIFYVKCIIPIPTHLTIGNIYKVEELNDSTYYIHETDSHISGNISKKWFDPTPIRNDPSGIKVSW